MMRMITKKNVGIVAGIALVGWYSVFAFNKVEQSSGIEYRVEIKSLKSDLEAAKTHIQALNYEGEENLARWYEFRGLTPEAMCIRLDEVLVTATDQRKQNRSMPKCLRDDDEEDNAEEDNDYDGPDVW